MRRDRDTHKYCSLQARGKTFSTIGRLRRYTRKPPFDGGYMQTSAAASCLALLPPTDAAHLVYLEGHMAAASEEASA